MNRKTVNKILKILKQDGIMLIDIDGGVGDINDISEHGVL